MKNDSEASIMLSGNWSYLLSEEQLIWLLDDFKC